MSCYEHVFIMRADISAQQVETITSDFTKVVEDGGAKVTKSEYWGLKALAYKIKKNRKAHYSLFNIDGPHAAVAELERQEQLHDDVMRSMTIRVEELDEGPSIMMQKNDRPDRPGGRGDRGPRPSHSDRGPRS